MPTTAKHRADQETGRRRAYMRLLAEVTSSQATPGWWHRAACREATDPDVFFRDEGDHIANRLFNIRIVQTYCATCPVSSQCLDEAMSMEGGSNRDYRHGIFGGLTSAMRLKVSQGKVPTRSAMPKSVAS